MGFKSFIVKADELLGTTVAEGGETPAPKIPLAASETTMMSMAFFTCASFIILGGRYIVGDFIPDELYIVPRLYEHSLPEFLLGFKHSCQPLYHGLLWLWVELFQGGAEAFLRLPGLAFILLSAYLTYSVGRRVLGLPGYGFLAMILVLFSPAVLTHFSQLFGYSLSIFLACLSTIGAMCVAKGERLKGAALFGIGALLLPATLAAGPWLNLSLVGFLVAHFLLLKKLKMNLILILGLAAVSVVTHPFLGFLPMSLDSESGNSINVIDGLGQWFIVVAAQLALFIIVSRIVSRQRDLPEETDSQPSTALLKAHLWVLFLASFAGSALYLLATQEPPATALCFSVPLAFGALGWIKAGVLKTNKYFLLTLMAVLLNLLLWMRGVDALTANQLSNGDFQPNLVQQFPGGERVVSSTVKRLRQIQNLPPNVRIFVDAQVFTPFAWYWQAVGGKKDNLESLSSGGELALEKEHYLFLPKIAIGFNPAQIQAVLQQQLKTTVMLQEIQRDVGMPMFRVLTPNLQERPSIPQPEPNPISYLETPR